MIKNLNKFLMVIFFLSGCAAGVVEMEQGLEGTGWQLVQRPYAQNVPVGDYYEGGSAPQINLGRVAPTLTPAEEIRINKQFVEAVHKKDPAILQKLLNESVVRGKRNPAEFVKFMTLPDASGWTPFMHAVEIGDPSRLNMFMDAFQKVLANDTASLLKIVNFQDVHGRTALHLAAERRQNDEARLLLKRFVEFFKNDKKSFFEILNNRDRHLGWTPLMAATYDSASEIIEAILKAAAQVLGVGTEYYNDVLNARGSFGRSAILLSIAPRDRWLLLQYGARDDVEPQDPLTKDLKTMGLKFLHYASHDGHEQDIEEFFQTLAEKYPENYQAFLFVLTARDEGGWTALMNAAADGNAEYVRIILSNAHKLFKTDTARVATPGREGERQEDPLWFSLVLNNADVHGRTSLHLAIARRHFDAFKTLLSIEKDYLGNDRRTFNRFINHRTELNGFTPLLLAAFRSADDELSLDMIKILVERTLGAMGRDSIDYERFINARDLDRQSSVAYALSPRIRDYLKKNGAR
ncbi:ankyrin repeat domain-containing protein [Candidatus Dependentiae bacterium]|nr:ankyrin repeat domain-containing protein [Candidatus Dependentiae bacterium]